MDLSEEKVMCCECNKRIAKVHRDYSAEFKWIKSLYTEKGLYDKIDKRITKIKGDICDKCFEKRKRVAHTHLQLIDHMPLRELETEINDIEYDEVNRLSSILRDVIPGNHFLEYKDKDFHKLEYLLLSCVNIVKQLKVKNIIEESK